MNPNLKKQIFAYTSVFFLVVTCTCIGLLYYNDRDLIHDREKISIQGPDLDKLIGFYYKGTIDAGILLLEGFGADQFMMKGIAHEFHKLGFHVFSFDYSGHGQSTGSIGFDNAQTNKLALQVLEARTQFMVISGLIGSEILLMGHSLGSRVAIQSTIMDSNVAGLILLGTQINLDTNTQSEFFTGVSDADLAWVDSLNGTNPATEILLISGSWDDILIPSAAQLLYEKLGGDTAPFNRDMMIFNHMLHNYEVYSPRAITYALNWAVDKLGLGFGDVEASTMEFRKILWSIGIPSLFLTLMLFNSFLSIKRGSVEESRKTQKPIEIFNPRKFLWGKLLLWLLSLPLCVLVAVVLSMIPIGVPVFNMIYVGFIAGYGIFILLLYRFRRKKLIPGVEGTFSMKNESKIDVHEIVHWYRNYHCRRSIGDFIR